MMIYQPPGHTIPADHIRTATRGNPDGWGVVWRSANGDLKSHVSMDMDAAEGFMGSLPKHELIFHARLGTGGQLSTRNCHPFKMHIKNHKTDALEEWFLAHNGIFSNVTVPIQNAMYSDTWHFAHMIENRANRDKEFDLRTMLGVDVLNERFGKMINTYNKVCFAGPDGFYIVNEKNGIWSDGIWYSNGGCFYTSWATSDTTRRSRAARRYKYGETEIGPGKNSTPRLVTAESVLEAVRSKAEVEDSDVRKVLQKAGFKTVSDHSSNYDALPDYSSTDHIAPKLATQVIMAELWKADDPFDCALHYTHHDPQPVAIMLMDYAARLKTEAEGKGDSECTMTG